MGRGGFKGPPRGRGKGPSSGFSRGAGAPTDRPERPRRPETPGSAARAAVHRLLSLQTRRFPDLEIAELDTGGLDPRDAALAHAIYDTVLRRWLTLQHLLTKVLDVPWEELHPKVAAALLAGAAQLIFFDKVPSHSAVDEAVRFAKTASVRSGGLVNAVLRNLVTHMGGDDAGIPRDVQPVWTPGRTELPLAAGGALRFKVELLPGDPMQSLSIATSHPVELLRQWAKSMPMADVRRLALHGVASPPVILNTAFATAPLPQEGLSVHASPGHHVWTGTHTALGELLRSRRDIWAQDPASALAVSSVSGLKPEVVIDVCAGMGTKTRQLAATFPGSRVIATDVDLPRFRTLQRVLEGLANVEVVAFDKLRGLAGTADLVLLDVPCSNTGVLARRVEARYRFERGRQEKLASMQKQIIADAIPLLRAGGQGHERGRILYSTCSLDPSENREQARWAAKWHMFKISREHQRLPEGGPGEPSERYSDGAYSVVLE